MFASNSQMKHTFFDVSSNGLSKHVTNVATATVTADAATTTATAGGLFSSFAIVNDPLPFVTLLFATIAIFLLRPAIYCARDFYRNCFKPKCWYGAWRRWVIDLVGFIVDILAIAAVVYFLWTQAGNTINPLIEGSQINLYWAVVVLVLLFLLFRWFWFNSFWNYHNTKPGRGCAEPVFCPAARIAIGFAVFFAVLMLLTVIGLIIVFAIAHLWITLLLLPLFVWTIVLLVWTGMVFACTGCPRVCEPVFEQVCPQVIPTCPTVVYGNQLRK